ncbi:MAG: hypothetical protein GKC03_09905 [Methanomassiliicoccales archaeon]|nr:hypothetical protein [Methanomassiliicoccales archaeon]NYT15440.1 hypothetical protein [Methanomassiliicoccales archaeon]
MITVAAIGVLLIISSLVTVACCHDTMIGTSIDSNINPIDDGPQDSLPHSALADGVENGDDVEDYESLGSTPSTFIRATSASPVTLDPSIAYDAASYEVIQNVYETLIWYDEGSTIDLVPMLATEVPTVENGGISADGYNYTFHIREGVYFHDLTMLNGYDVEYSIERVLTMNDPEGPCWTLTQILYENWPGPGEELDPGKVDSAVTVNSTDPFEVTFHLYTPYSPFLQVLAMPLASIISMDYVEAHGGVVALEQNEWMRTHEAGTGPFYLSNLSETNVTLSRNTNYWREVSELNQVIIMSVADAEVRKQMLINGTVDSAELSHMTRDELISNPDLKIVEGLPTFEMEFLGFNWNMSGVVDTGNVPADFFTDYNVRRAFVHSFDYDNFLENVWRNTTIQPNGPIPLGMFGFDPSVPNYTMNLSLAADFLNETSYGATGFNIILYYDAGNDERETACFLLKQGLESVPIAGEINVTIQALDWPTYLDAVYDKGLPIYFLGWGPDYADPDDYVNPLLHSDGPFPYFLSLSNSTLDLMITEAASELNSTLRAEMYLNISNAVYENGYCLWTAQQTSFHVERTWVTGYYFNPMYGGLYYYPLGLDRDPSEPLNFTLRAYVDRIELDWDPPMDSGAYNLTGYKIYKGDSESSMIVIEQLDNSTTNWTDYDFTDGESLYYAVAAVNEMFEGNMSEILHIHAPDKPGQIASFVAVSGNGTVELWWAEPFSNGTIGIDHYNIYRGLSIGEMMLVDTVSDPSLRYLDLNVTNGVTYYYCISAENAKGEGELSVVRTARPLPVVDHDPIRINNDTELISMAAMKGWSGNGSQYNPIHITSLSIDAGLASSGIYIGNVSLYFRITESNVMNCTLLSPSIIEGAVTIFNSSNGLIWNCTFDQCTFGVVVRNSTNIGIQVSLMNSNVYTHIYVNGSNDVLIGNSTMLLSDYGVIFDHSNDCIIEANSIVGMGGETCSSMIIGYGSNYSIRYNQIDRCYRAIMMGFVSNAHVHDNHISNISQMGISIANSEQCTIEDNTIDSTDDDTVGIGVSGDNMEIRNNWIDGLFVGIGVSSSTNVSIESNVMVNGTGAGIELTQSSAITVSENTCSNGYGGIFLYEMENCTLWRNNISSNGFIGLEMYDSVNITVFESIFENNAEYAVMVVGGGENHFTWNSFEGNNGASDSYSVDHVQAYDDTGTDLWNHTVGNYWSDWTSPDVNSDGIVDVPYILDGGSLSDQLPMTLDPYLPSVTFAHPLEGMYLKVSSQTVRWIGEIDIGEIDHYMISLDGGEWIDLGLSTSYNTSDLSEGEHEFVVNVTSSYGYSATASVHFVIDISDPTLHFSSPSEDAMFNMSSVQLTWIGEDLVSGIDHYEIRLDGGEWVDVGTNTSYLAESLTEGWHNAELRAFDNATNLANDTVDFFVDSTAPSVLFGSPSEGAMLNTSTIQLAWTGEDLGSGIDHYEIRLDSGEWIDVGMNTSFLTESLTDGVHRAEVRAFDGVNNSMNDTVNFMIDTIAPLVQILSPSSGAIITNTSLDVEWQGSDAVSGISSYFISIDGSDWIDLGHATSYHILSMDEGEHEIMVRSVDNVTNEANATISFLIDISEPTLTIGSPLEDAVLDSSDVVIDWSGQDEWSGIDHFEIGLDDLSRIDVGTSNSYAFSDLTEGLHTVEIVAYDKAGFTTSRSVNFTVDTVAPEISFIEPTEGYCLNSLDVVVTWTMTDLNSGISHCEIRLDDNQGLNIGSNTSISLTGLEEGIHDLVLTVHDVAGNWASVALGFTVDTIAPVVNLLSPVFDEDWAEIRWTGSDDGSGMDHYDMQLDDGNWQDMGLLTRADLISLSEGEHHLMVRAVDRAGNVRVSNTVSWLVDTTSPTVVSYSPQGSEVPLNTQIILIFSENISSCTVFFSPGGIGASIHYNGSVVVIVLTNELWRATNYTVSINAQDLNGNPMEHEWSFSTHSKVLIWGKVMDRNSFPISECNITIGDQVIASTNSSGYFQCEIEGGNYTIMIEKEGFKLVTKSIAVTEGEEFNLGNVYLQEEADGEGDQVLVPVAAVIAVVVIALGVGLLWIRRR